MKNTNLFPFERNNYYYGKLLSAEDFELEQKYINDKRRMLSRMMYGSGVLAGLLVVDVDEQTISVEAGVAIDAYGREIVVDRPFVRALSDIDGYSTESAKSGRYIYLCIEYDEEASSRTFNITDVPVPRDSSELSYGHISEKYHLYIKSGEPTESLPADRKIFENELVFNPVEDVTIRHSIPRFSEAGNQVMIHINVENLGRHNLSFSYDLILNHLTNKGQPRIHVLFDEMLFERTGSYELTYPVNVSDIGDEEASLSVDPDTLKLSISGQLRDVKLSGELTSSIIKGSSRDAMANYYYNTSMNDVLKKGGGEEIYLARIFLVQASGMYLIEKVTPMPFGQYIYSSVLAGADRRMAFEKGLSGEPGGGIERKSESRHASLASYVPMTQGVCEIALDSPAKRGDRFFSKKILHGLGIGDVAVTLGMEKLSGHVVYGSSEVYDQKRENGVDAELAAAVDPQNGSFTIGVRLIAETSERICRVHWTAIKNPLDEKDDAGERRLFIKPNVLELVVREAYILEAVCENMAEKAVRWSVQEHGGTIDEHGVYTAPGIPGVYEVMASSIAFPEVRASIYVLVREA